MARYGYLKHISNSSPCAQVWPTSSGEVYSMISVQRFEQWIVPRFCWLDLRLAWSWRNTSCDKNMWSPGLVQHIRRPSLHLSLVTKGKAFVWMHSPSALPNLTYQLFACSSNCTFKCLWQPLWYVKIRHTKIQTTYLRFQTFHYNELPLGDAFRRLQNSEPKMLGFHRLTTFTFGFQLHVQLFKVLVVKTSCSSMSLYTQQFLYHELRLSIYIYINLYRSTYYCFCGS